MIILCLCEEDNHRKLIPGYASAFRERGVQFLCVNWSPPFSSPLEQILEHYPERPSYIFHFESDFPLLPEGLNRSEIPTVSFQVDTNAFTKKRMRWSSIFDHVAVFHPGYDKLFRESGHPGAFLLPHAVRGEFFEGPDLLRDFEVGWVGQTKGALYRKRHKLIPMLANAFRMNDWQRTYSLQEVAEIYRRSRIVVNIGRDDFPQDANMRAFEVLASGALLVTSVPSELSDLGFQEGQHFIGYRTDSDLVGLVRTLLRDEVRRAQIAQAARSLVLQEHTYDRRVVQLVERLGHFGQTKFAPARAWPESRVRLVYLDFFASSAEVDSALIQFGYIVGRGLRETIVGAIILCKMWMKSIYIRLRKATIQYVAGGLGL